MAHYAESPARLRHPLRHWKLSVLGKHSLVCEEARAVAVTTARTRSAADPETRLKLWRLGKSPVSKIKPDMSIFSFSKEKLCSVANNQSLTTAVSTKDNKIKNNKQNQPPPPCIRKSRIDWSCVFLGVGCQCVLFHSVLIFYSPLYFIYITKKSQFKNTTPRIRKIVLQVSCLPCKHEDLSVNASTYIKVRHGGMCQKFLYQ